jgi:hypothetical protein
VLGLDAATKLSTTGGDRDGLRDKSFERAGSKGQARSTPLQLDEDQRESVFDRFREGEDAPQVGKEVRKKSTDAHDIGKKSLHKLHMPMVLDLLEQNLPDLPTTRY